MLSGSKATGKLDLGILLEFDETWMGGVNYIISLLKTLMRLSPQDRPLINLIVTQNSTEVQKAFADFEDIKIICLKEPPKFLKTLPRFLKSPLSVGYRLVQKRNIVKQANIDLLFPLVNYWDLLVPTGGIGWIPDFQHKYLPEFFPEREISKRDNNYNRMAQMASYMIFSSKTAKEDFEKYYPHFKSTNFVYSFRTVLDEKISLRSLKELKEQYGLGDKFLYLPNQFWAHKNHRLVFRALADLAKSGKRIEVVCTGSSYENRNNNYFSEILRIKEQNNLDNIKILGLVPREDQYSLYYYSQAIIQPSLFEGWSTIVEDARAFGKTILLSDIPVHREQNPPGAVFFDPHKQDEFAEKLVALWETLVPEALPYAELLKKQEIQIKEAAQTLSNIFLACQSQKR